MGLDLTKKEPTQQNEENHILKSNINTTPFKDQDTYDM